MSHQPSPSSTSPTTAIRSSGTAPGPPISSRGISTQPQLAKDLTHPSNPFQVDFVIPFDISIKKGQDRLKAQKEIREGYERLLRSLEGCGLRVGSKASRGKKSKDEIWVFVSITDKKLKELITRERLLDESHNIPLRPEVVPPSDSTRLRLLYSLLTCPDIQHGLGITPGKGDWGSVKSIMALHDEESDKEWLKTWSIGGDWTIGLLRGLGNEHAGLGEHQTPSLHLYFDFLTTYTLSLLPISIIGILFWLFTPSDSYPPLYAFLLALYSTIFVAVWRIRERKLAVRWGTKGCEDVAVGRLRPEYIANLTKSGTLSASNSVGGRSDVGGNGGAIEALQKSDDLKRDVKVLLSGPVIVICGVGLGCVIMGIFVLEAFVSQVYEGLGKEVVPLIPTALFVLLVPQVVGLYNSLSKGMVSWEDHPTPVGAEKSLTGKTFAMNGIVAYLGLFLSAYVYVPFGPFIMANIQQRLNRYSSSSPNINISSSPEKAGLGPSTAISKQHEVKAGRLKGQLFAYTVTNQVVNAFLELGLPFILRFIDDLRSGQTSMKDIKQTIKGNHPTQEKEANEDAESRFMKKVERELCLPEYSLFTDYAEMVTQFGYVVIWSIVWPLAPLFAFLNNYFEIRGDAVKVTQHVRRPIGDRVETIGSWLDTLQIISWIGAVTSSTLIYLFRPSTLLHPEKVPQDMPLTGSIHLHRIVSTYSDNRTLQFILPTLIPMAAVALTASHGHIVLKWIVEGIAERLLWRGSKEEEECLRLVDSKSTQIREKLKELDNHENEEKGELEMEDDKLRGGFWNGGEDGAKEIARAVKAE